MGGGDYFGCEKCDRGMGLFFAGGIALRDEEFRQEADWRACGDGGWNVDGGGACGGGGGEYVSDLLFESAAVAGGGGEAGGCEEDAGAASEA